MTDFSTSGGWSDPTTTPPQDPYTGDPLAPPLSPPLPVPMPPPPPGSYGGYGGYGAPNQQIYYQPAAPRTNSTAVASMILSIVGLVLFFCYGIGGLPGLIGAILGHVAKRQIRERGEAGDGMAKAGIIMGWIAVGLSVVILAIFIALIVAAVSSAGTAQY
jgi:hypothetical protein